MTLKLKARRNQLGSKRREKATDPAHPGKQKGERNAVNNNIKQNPNVQTMFQRMEKIIETS